MRLQRERWGGRDRGEKSRGRENYLQAEEMIQDKVYKPPKVPLPILLNCKVPSLDLGSVAL
jgi:hypothetical protein